ncbi:TPA_asm: hypothetical protein PROPHIFSQJ01-1_38 [Mycobacterium phage prophiFSQJ01-1]|nr:Uncharacterised protein [Mycobacteroides abscessus subsp. abscessus]SIK14368.1 Uncharacterised protein [Mycobacteroides abscessus subsp. abscessus]SIN25282.1 Uncharacterised protein [Mycobacteroides abscessus subsp. abscessus]SLI51625.1 Uncharacterised protein [Mycobacteroides abscessus subsp. abscessus]DAZ90324.1 TPA_asm: hypothetical protein PROPHIFSQJ01-1_38 [Mycobacterium phage prophiFSQJ01-1]
MTEQQIRNDCFSVSASETVKMKQSETVASCDCFKNPKGFLNTGRETLALEPGFRLGLKQSKRNTPAVLERSALDVGRLSLASESTTEAMNMNQWVIERQTSDRPSEEVLGCQKR